MRKLKDRPQALIFKDQSLTEQAHANDVDINQIMAKAQHGVPSDYIKDHAGHYMDATSLDYFEAQVLIANANSLFEDLPSSIRNRFDNEPGKFLDFVQDPKNADELVTLKLRNPPEPTELPSEPTPPTEPLVTDPTPPTPD